MSASVGDVKQRLNDSIAKHAAAEGLTFTSLKGIVVDLKQQEEVSLSCVFSSCAKEYASATPPDARVDEAAITFGSREPGTSRKEQKQLLSLAGQHQKVAIRLQEIRQEAESLKCAAHLQSKLAEFQSFSSSGKYVEAAECIVGAAESLIQQPGFAEGSDEAQMRDEFAARGSGLAKDLAQQVDQAVICSHSDDLAHAEFNVADPSRINQQWLALKILREEEVSLANLSTSILQHLFCNDCLPKSTQQDNSDTLKKLRSSLTGEDGIANQESIHEALKDTLDFIGEWGLGNDASLCKRIGQLLWPSIARIYIKICLKPLTLSVSADIPLHERILESAEKLENDITDLGFLSVGDDLTQMLPIHAYTQQAKDTLLRTLRLDLVSDARELMLQPLEDVATSPGKSSVGFSEHESSNIKENAQGFLNAISAPFQKQKIVDRRPQTNEADVALLSMTGAFQVSKSVVEILELTKVALSKAADAKSGIMAQACISALAEIADLYSAVPQTLWSRQLQVPVIAALYHNNCHYLAEELVLRFSCYQDLPSNHTSTLGAIYPSVMSLRDSGTAVLNMIVRQQIRELEEIMAGAQGFKRITEAKRGLQARRTVQQVLHTLRRLGTLLRPILPTWAFVELGVKLIASPAESAVSSVMSSTDISVDESEDIPRILEPLATESASSFVGLVSQTQPDSEIQQIAHAVEESCSQLQRLQAVLEIMGARLGTIRSSWEEGHFKAKGMSAAEVVHLVKALFEDTDLRDAVIDDIESS